MPTLNLTWRPNEGIFQKKTATLCYSGQINSAPDNENRTKITKAVPEKRWQVCTHLPTCAWGWSFTRLLSTKLSRQTANGVK